MLGLRSIRRYLVISFAAIILSLLTASLAVAQTAVPIIETSTASKEEPATYPAVPIKTETEPAKPVAAAPPQIVPCPPGTRKIPADVVAIPQPIMMNRLGATIPNGFVFALRSDTVISNGNIWLRPG